MSVEFIQPAEHGRPAGGGYMPIDPLTAHEHVIITEFRAVIRENWTLEEARDAQVRETRAARDQVAYALWLRSAPSTDEIAATPVTTSAIESESEPQS